MSVWGKTLQSVKVKLSDVIREQSAQENVYIVIPQTAERLPLQDIGLDYSSDSEEMAEEIEIKKDLGAGIITKHNPIISAFEDTLELEKSCTPNCNLGVLLTNDEDQILLKSSVTNHLSQKMNRLYVRETRTGKWK